MPDTTPISKLATPFAYLMMAVHVIGAGVGVYALMTLAGDALPAWQSAVLLRAIFLVPLFVFFEQLWFLEANVYPRTTYGIVQSSVPMIATVAFSYWHFGSWLEVALNLSMPMLGFTGLVWLVASFVFPVIIVMNDPSPRAVGTILAVLVVYSMFIIPTVGVLISLFTFAGQTLFAGGITLTAVFLLLSMAGMIALEGYRYLTALGAFEKK